MAEPVTIHGELRVPAALMQGQPMAELEDHLRTYGLLPDGVAACRWRMDPERPGGYLLAYEVTLPSEEVP